MKIHSVITTCVLILLFCCSALSIAQQDDTVQERLKSQAQDALTNVVRFVDTGALDQAEANCQQAIDLFAQAGAESDDAHTWMGRILILKGLPREAFREVTWGWRVGKNSRTDLLVAITGASLDTEGANLNAKSALLMYCMKKCDYVAERVGQGEELPSFGDDSMPHHPTPVQIQFASLVLLAADPDTRGWEAEQYIARAQQLIPDNAAASFVLGSVYLREKKTDSARTAFTFAKDHGSARLREKATAALSNLPVEH